MRFLIRLLWVSALLGGLAGAQPLTVDTAMKLLAARSEALEGLQVEYQLTVQLQEGNDTYLRGLNELMKLSGNPAEPFALGQFLTRPFECDEECSFVRSGARLWLRSRDLTEPAAQTQQIGYNGKLWHVYSPATRTASVADRSLWPDALTYADGVDRMMHFPRATPRSGSRLTAQLQTIATDGEVQVEAGKSGGVELVAYQKWPSKQGIYAGYRISMGPAPSLVVTRIECFSARRNGRAYEQVHPCSITHFASFERVAEAVSLPRLISIEEYSQLTTERDPRVIQGRPFDREPAESILTRRLELRVKSFHRLSKAEETRFDPIFAKGTQIYDELTATNYTAGEPVKNVDRELRKFDGKQ